MTDPRTSDLSKPLPAGVVIGEFGTGLFYEKYAAFSWAWAWRRTLLLGLIAVPFGALVGVMHGLYSHDLVQGLDVGLRFSLGNLAMVGLAPVLAATVRHRHLAESTERALVVAAVVLGVCGALLVKAHAHNHHDELMGSTSTVVGRLIKLFTGEVDGHAMASGISDFILYVGLYAVCGGALALRSYLREPQRWQDHLQRIEVDAVRGARLDAERRLALLQAQVEPHFLFNTLASVRSLAQVDPRRAVVLIDALGSYLRSTLPRLRNDRGDRLSTLAEQFEICRGYLQIMNLRLGDRLAVHIRLPRELERQPFPPLLLISLVENAVTHGVEPKVGAAAIAIEARRVGGGHTSRLTIEVLDDGVGLREGLVEGTGLANVREQLRTIYGDEARLSVQSPPAGGVKVGISVPLQAAAA